MSYAATNWATGDVITAEKLNKIENGIENISGSIYTVTITNIDYTNSTFTYDKTWNEIKAAYEAGKHVILRQLYVGTLYKILEIESVEFTSETGALKELQFFRIDVNQGMIEKSFFIINENKSTFTNSRFTRT